MCRMLMKVVIAIQLDVRLRNKQIKKISLLCFHESKREQTLSSNKPQKYYTMIKR